MDDNSSPAADAGAAAPEPMPVFSVVIFAMDLMFCMWRIVQALLTVFVVFAILTNSYATIFHKVSVLSG